jgi:glycerol uptake facilitator-like aquaporin
VTAGTRYWLAQLLGAGLAGLLLRWTRRHPRGDPESLTGTDAAIPVGFTIALDGRVAGQLTGASMNPARECTEDHRGRRRRIAQQSQGVDLGRHGSR